MVMTVFLSLQNIEWIHKWLWITHLYSFSFSKINLSRKNNEYHIHYNGSLLQGIFCPIHFFTPKEYDKINSIFKQLNGIIVPLISIAKPQQEAFPVDSFSFVWMYDGKNLLEIKMASVRFSRVFHYVLQFCFFSLMHQSMKKTMAVTNNSKEVVFAENFDSSLTNTFASILVNFGHLLWSCGNCKFLSLWNKRY